MRLIALQKTSSPDYLRIIFDAWRRRAVIVPTDTPATVTLPGMVITDRLVAVPGGGWFDETLALDDDAAPAQISFTSGTTGAPKPVLLSRRALSDVTRRLNAVMRIDSSIREYIGVPVTFSFGLGRARAIAAVGGRSFLPSTGFRPDEIAAMLADGEINALSAVPTLVRILIEQRALFAQCGDRLRWLEIGSQPMSAVEKKAVRDIFPHARIVQHYGLTEASRSTFLVVNEADDAALESVGHPETQAALRIDPDGRIAVRGGHVADGIVTAGGVMPLADAEGWLVTNDLGAIDDTGRLHFKGRADHLINVSGIKVPAELFEERLAAALGADGASIAIAGQTDPLRGETVMVAYLPGLDAVTLREKARAIAAGFGLGTADVRLVEVPEIPRTETGKVRRAELTALDANVVVPPAAANHGAMSPREREIAAIWQEALGIARIGTHETFFELGGDSLSAIGAMLRMERSGMPRDIAQAMLEGRTIAEIAALAPGGKLAVGPQAQMSDAINMTRGLLVLVVIAAHWLPFLIVRAGSWAPLLDAVSNPVFRLGTVGFAIVFGIGLSFFYLPTLRRSEARLDAKLRTNALVVGGGVVLLAAIRAAALLLGGDRTFATQWAGLLFYNVLFFYLLMILSAGLILRQVARMRFQAIDALLCAAVLMLVAALLHVGLGGPQRTGLIELARLMLTAKYSYPLLLSYVMIGIAIGYWIEHGMDRADLMPQLVRAGAALILLGLGLSYSLGLDAAWEQSTANGPMVICYAGVVLLLFVLMAKLRVAAHSRAVIETGRLLLVIGLLAFPAFVAHESVIGIKDILIALHMRYILAMALTIGLFVLGSVLAVRRVRRLYYG